MTKYDFSFRFYLGGKKKPLKNPKKDKKEMDEASFKRS